MSRLTHASIEVYKTKWFARFARKARIDDQLLWRSAVAADVGVVDADLGHGIVKQRIARAGGGKSGGLRAFLVIRRHDLAVYIFGFEKKDQANVDSNEWEALKKIADELLSFTGTDIARNRLTGELIRVEPVEESNG